VGVVTGSDLGAVVGCATITGNTGFGAAVAACALEVEGFTPMMSAG
jgi:hypothetical protein